MPAKPATQVSIASGRLAFALGTQGACASIDTACSPALVALDAATLSLRACDAALAAAANLLLQPFVSLLFARAGMLSADGRCKTCMALRHTECRRLAAGVDVILTPVIAGRFALAGAWHDHANEMTMTRPWPRHHSHGVVILITRPWHSMAAAMP